MSRIPFQPTRPGVGSLQCQLQAGSRGSALPEGCAGDCRQGRKPCTCHLAMPCVPGAWPARRAAHAQQHAAGEPCLTAPQDLETTPDELWDGQPLDQVDGDVWRWYLTGLAIVAALFFWRADIWAALAAWGWVTP